jgi:hypothetical protein
MNHEQFVAIVKQALDAARRRRANIKASDKPVPDDLTRAITRLERSMDILRSDRRRSNRAEAQESIIETMRAIERSRQHAGRPASARG